MKLLKITKEFRVDSESQAKDSIADAMKDAADNGYIISFWGYTYKTKKSKGEIIDEAWVVKVTEEHESLWG